MNSVVSCCCTHLVHLHFRCDLIILVRLVNFLGWEKTWCDWGGSRTLAGAVLWNGNRTGWTVSLNSVSATSTILIALWPGRNA